MQNKLKKIIPFIIIAVVICTSILIYLIKSKDKSLDVADVNTLGRSLKPVTLTIYLQGEEPKGFSNVVKEIERRTKGFLNASFDFEWVGKDGYYSHVYNNSKIDAFYIPNLEIEKLSVQEYRIIKDITKLFPQYAPNYFRQFDKEELALDSINGKLYGIPNRYPVMNRINAIIREDLRIKYNLPEIKSYSDLQRYIETIARNEKDIIPIQLPYGISSMDLFASACGYAILDDSLNLVYKWDDPEMKIMPWEQVPEYKDINKKIYGWKKIGGTKEGVVTDDTLIPSGKCACYLIYYNGFDKAKDMNQKVNSPEIKYKRYTLYDNKVSERSNMYGAICLNSMSSNSERVMRFIDWVQSSKENYDLVVHTGGITPLYNIYNEQITASSEKGEYLNQIEKLTKYPPHSGFLLDRGKLDEYLLSKRERASNEVESNIFNGSFSDGTVDSYISEQLKDVRINEIVKQIQKQLDNWREVAKPKNTLK